MLFKNIVSEAILRKIARKARSINQGKKMIATEIENNNLKTIYIEDILSLSNLIQKDLTHWTK